MTDDSFFFDTDCLSAFLWINGQSILTQLYPNRIIIPKEVYEELSNPRISHLKNRVDNMVSMGTASITEIEIGTEEAELFYEMTENTESGRRLIGKGEASAIVLAKKHSGIVASNNFRDILFYVKEYNLPYMTTGDILCEALEKGIINESQGNVIWQRMLSKRRKLGANSFSEYLASKQ